MVKKLRENKAITLIALVITIIVLLILAGVAISMLSGENGILNQAVHAKEKTEEESVRESIRLAELAARTLKEGKLTKEDLENELKSYFGENGFTVEETQDEEGTQTGFKVTVGKVVEDIEEKGVKDVGEPTLKVTLKVKEADVTGTQIPVMVEKVTEDDTQTEEDLTYTWFKEDVEEGTNESSHTFSGLSESKSYTLKCKVSSKSGEWGEAEVKVLSFRIGESYYRCTDGMTWKQWCESSYPAQPPKPYPEKSVFSGTHPEWGPWMGEEGEIKVYWEMDVEVLEGDMICTWYLQYGVKVTSYDNLIMEKNYETVVGDLCQ